MKPNVSRLRGFTLIELMVVISIIAVLASLLLPTLSRAKAGALVAKCKSNERQLGFATAMYVGEFRAYPYSAFGPVRTAKGAAFWFDLLSPYVANGKWGDSVFRCPTYKWSVIDGGGSGSGSGFSLASALGAYSYNGMPFDSDGGGPYGVWHPGIGTFSIGISPLPAVPESAVRAPSELYALGDAELLESWTDQWRGGDFDFGFGFRLIALEGARAKRISQHPKGHNMLFVDGHVEEVNYDRLFSKSNFVCQARWHIDRFPLE
jgi:prepilin-type N-terminal cleavage/methylation domain-containing protein/prepilin-type processing-associated H-X9-DG protein